MPYFEKLKSINYLYFFLVAIAYIFCNGYLFNTGDQAEHLPQVYQKLNPELYPNDFFLNYYNQTFTVRYYFTYVVYAFSLVVGVKASCFIIYFCYQIMNGMYLFFYVCSRCTIFMSIYNFLFF